VLDDAGQPVRERQVRWKLPSGAGHLSDTLTYTDSSGVAQVQWTLPSSPSDPSAPYGVEATIADSSILFQAVALPESSADLEQGRVLGEGPTDYSFFIPPHGTVRGVVVFGSYSDLPWDVEPSAVYEEYFPRMIEWYREVSYGRLELVVTPLPQWLELPKTRAQYESEGYRTVTEDVLNVADPEVDFREYDIVFFVSSGYGLNGSNLVNAGAGYLLDGVEVRGSVLFSPRSFVEDLRWLVLAHEAGHHFGLPDLYRSISGFTDNVYAGSWDLMSREASGAHFFGWHKRKLGWLESAQVLALEIGGVEAILQPLEVPGGLKIVVVKTSPWTAYVIEVRQPIGYDANLCDFGVLVYYVDSRIGTGEGPIRVSRHSGTAGACGPLSHAPLDLGAGEASKYVDPEIGLTVQVLSREPAGAFRVRVRRDPEEP